MQRWIVLAMAVTLPSLAAHAGTFKCPPSLTRMEMTKGSYSPMPGATFDLENFSARMTARGKTSPACYNRDTDIEHGTVFISSESLTHLFEKKIQQSKSNVSDVKVEIKDNLAHLSGKVKKGMDVPFDIEGPVTTDGSKLILEAKKIKAEGIPVKGLLGMLGKHLGDILGSENVEGVKAVENSLIFDPALISRARGKIAKIDLTDKGMSIVFEPMVKTTKATKTTKPEAKGAKATAESAK